VLKKDKELRLFKKLPPLLAVAIRIGSPKNVIY
jgi:hypothetical protein